MSVMIVSVCLCYYIVSTALPEWVNFRTISNIDRMERLKRIRGVVAESSKRVNDVGSYLLEKEFPDSSKAVCSFFAYLTVLLKIQ